MSVTAVALGLLAGVLFEREAILDDDGQGSEVRDSGDLDSVPEGSAGKVA
jgi:hypothetical protein